MASGDGIVPEPSLADALPQGLIGRRHQAAEAAARSSSPIRVGPSRWADVRPQRREDRPPRHVPRRRQHRRARRRPRRGVGVPGAPLPPPDGRGEGRAVRHHAGGDRGRAYPEELEDPLDGIRKLQSNGVRFVAGGDFGHQWTKHGTYAAELVAYVELVGMSPTEALLTATANAGPLVGQRLGQVAEGYLADLVLVHGDPASDVAVLLDHDRIGPVFKGGRPTGTDAWGDVAAWATAHAGP